MVKFLKLKKLVFLFLLLTTLWFVASGQVIPAELSTKTALPAPVLKKHAVSGDEAVIKILPDADCTVYVDGEKKGYVKANNILRVPLQRGMYVLRIVGNNKADAISKDYVVETIGVQTLLRINLKDMMKMRMQKDSIFKSRRQTDKLQ